MNVEEKTEPIESSDKGEKCKNMVEDEPNLSQQDETPQQEEQPQQDVISSKYTTMWIGTENGSLYVHSAIAQCRRCLHSVKLRDTIMSIV